MKVTITSDRQVWKFTAYVTVISTIASEVSLLGIYLLFGDAVFTLPSILLVGGFIPLLVAGPVSWLMATAQHDLTRAHKRMARLAQTDPLTGMPNRRTFFQHAAEVLTSARLNGEEATLLILDADHFKDLNDRHGHSSGDQALQHIARLLEANLRKTDLVCRLGGEEFAALLPGTSQEHASELARRIVRAINDAPLQLEGEALSLTVSCGYADTAVAFDIDQLYKAADDAMYGAKVAGRNRAVAFTPALALA